MNLAFVLLIVVFVALLTAFGITGSHAKLKPIDRGYVDTVTELDPVTGANLRRKLEEVDARNLEGAAEEDAIYDDAAASGGALAEQEDYIPPATFVKGMCLNF
jgi:hypothetical protein